MNKVKLAVSVVNTSKKYNRIKKFKNSTFENTNEKINFSINLPNLKKRIKFILSLICDFSTEVSIRICDENEMLNTNFYYKQKNYPTDVLSFPYQEKSSNNSELNYLGDILICLPICYNQAIRAHKPLSHEIEKMIIHGIVHLKGFDHERNKSAWKVMTLLEQSLQRELHKTLGKPAWCNSFLSNK